jgi:hypothetical protein
MRGLATWCASLRAWFTVHYPSGRDTMTIVSVRAVSAAEAWAKAIGLARHGARKRTPR